MSNLYVSVIIPCYNVENFIVEGINSILNQTYTNIEVVCIDDCSTDKTYEILLKFAQSDSRIKIFKNEKNLGLVGTLNKLIEFASNDILIRMDPDDISVENRIEKLVNEHTKTKSNVISSRYSLIDIKGKKLPYKGYDILFSPIGIKYTSLFNSPIPHAPALIHKDIFSKFNYDKEYLAAEDYNLWVNLILNDYNDFVILNEILYLYRINNTSASFVHNSIQAKNHLIISQKAVHGILGMSSENLNVLFSKNNFENNVYTEKKFKEIITELKQIKIEFIKKTKPNKLELKEINKYTKQHLVFLLYKFLKSMNLIEKIRVIKCVVSNFRTFISITSMKFILKRIV